MNNASSFFDAIKAGETSQVEKMLQDQPDLLAAKNEQGISPVLLAAYYGQSDVLDALFKLNPVLSVFEAAAVGQQERLAERIEADPACVNAWSPDGFTPLGLTAFFGQLEALCLLLDNGAHVNVASQNALQVRPIHSAVAHRNPPVALKMAKQLLAHDAQVKVAQQGGWTPLHQAAAHGQVDMVDLLLAHGADVHVQSEDGRTPADMAQENDHEDVVALLTAALAS